MISNACGAMYWKSDQMFVCKLEGKDVPELAVPREKVSAPADARRDPVNSSSFLEKRVAGLLGEARKLPVTASSPDLTFFLLRSSVR